MLTLTYCCLIVRHWFWPGCLFVVFSFNSQVFKWQTKKKKTPWLGWTEQEALTQGKRKYRLYIITHSHQGIGDRWRQSGRERLIRQVCTQVWNQVEKQGEEGEYKVKQEVKSLHQTLTWHKTQPIAVHDNNYKENRFFFFFKNSPLFLSLPCRTSQMSPCLQIDC